ncbi:hypothetical protein KNE206_63570 [Kitasatospora sp. NE20-6]|uniref:hypothetical protein n=1 Tax=Kitasatospora sp. NE20-6 TaxID=2859066 RepID=UPI0034DBD921
MLNTGCSITAPSSLRALPVRQHRSLYYWLEEFDAAASLRTLPVRHHRSPDDLSTSWTFDVVAPDPAVRHHCSFLTTGAPSVPLSSLRTLPVRHYRPLLICQVRLIPAPNADHSEPLSS